MTSSVGTATTSADANVSVSGIQLTSSQGSTIGGAPVEVSVTGSLQWV